MPCGIGLLTCELAKRVGVNGKIIATDISRKQLDVAKKLTKKLKIFEYEDHTVNFFAIMETCVKKIRD